MENKIIFFDAGPVITLIMSRLSWILPELKKQFNGKFYLTPAVHHELIERPLTMKRFKFEALQVSKLVHDGVFEVYDKVPQKKVRELESLANGAFLLDDKAMDIVQSGELESVAAALQEGILQNSKGTIRNIAGNSVRNIAGNISIIENAPAVVMDERTLRLAIENPLEVQHLLENRFQKKIISRQEKIKAFSGMLKEVRIIRSIELIAIAYRLGLLEGYIPDGKDGREELLDAVFWAAKLNGAAITEQEIEELKEFLKGK
ncbi:hypothetical protein HYX13_04670 [Candidatus Woesearchaeota archaeon]|nr:hypothetical protein [Candidatus Woesearchaeota archaeon]